MISRYSLTASLLIAFLFAIGLAFPAQAQHPTAVTSIVNNEADTSLEVNHNGSLLAPGDLVTDGTENDSIPAEGAGTRLMWYPEKAAFRAGQVGDNLDGTQWDASKVGFYSVAFGQGTEASGNWAMAVGRETTASGSYATAMGRETTASGSEATAMGDQTIASTNEATAMGRETTASGFYATAMGRETTASGPGATSMGLGTTASGARSTAMGLGTTAATKASLSIGECNSANTSDDFSVLAIGNGTFLSGSCDSRSDALVLKKDGDLGVGGAFRLPLAGGIYAGHFVGSTSQGASDPAGHIAFVENNGGTNSDGLAVLAGPNDNPGSAVNYLTFYDGDGDPIGAIQGNGSGGIERVSGSGDFAEELPVAEGNKAPEAADLVGVEGGAVSLQTEGVDRVMIASRAPILTGNATPANRADDARRVAVAFVGQVPAKVRGPAQPGDLIVPSGKEDGTARAVSPEAYRRSKHGPIAGQAWSAKETSEVGEVTVAVGIGSASTLAQKLEEERQRNQAQQRQIDSMKKRLAALEEGRATSLPAGLTGPWAFGLLLGLGGLAVGLLWRHQR